MLEEDVSHSHFERSQLRDLLAYLRGDEVAAPGRRGDGDRSLRPPSRPCLDLRATDNTDRHAKCAPRATAEEVERGPTNDDKQTAEVYTCTRK